MPVFAALDGRVLSVQQGVGGDFNWGPTVSNFDNHVILDHGGEQHPSTGTSRGRASPSRRGSGCGRDADRPDRVERELELAAPPLHRPQSFAPYEPFAGACGRQRLGAQPRSAASLVADVALSAKPFSGKATCPTTRRSAPARSSRRRFVNVRVEVATSPRPGPGGSIRRPDGSVAYAGALSASGSRRLGEAAAELTSPRSAAGGSYELGGSVVAEAPFDVVATDARRQPAAERRRRGARAGVAARRRGRRLPGRDVARDRGSRLRDRALPLPLDVRRSARPPGHERRALGRAPERRGAAGRDAHLRGDAVGREAARADGLRRATLPG